MAYPFSLARGITEDGKRVEGTFDHITNSIRIPTKSSGYKCIDVDFQSLRFNTGFVDACGNEIFEGDILETGDKISGDDSGFYDVTFDRETGSWELIPQTEPFARLTQRIASASFVNNGYETWQKCLDEDKTK